MEFEWDEDKSERNLEERGHDFAFAALIFLGETMDAVDRRKDYGEIRIQSIGDADGEILFVVHTDRGGVRRIISSRRASRKERELWRQFAGQSNR